jgi:hypothetical protein
MKMRLLLVGLLAGLLAGCSSWPEEGTGGLAERMGSDNPRLNSLTLRNIELVSNGAVHTAAAALNEGQQRLISASRELAAGMTEDAALSMDQAERLFDEASVRTPKNAPRAPR